MMLTSHCINLINKKRWWEKDHPPLETVHDQDYVRLPNISESVPNPPHVEKLKKKFDRQQPWQAESFQWHEKIIHVEYWNWIEIQKI